MWMVKNPEWFDVIVTDNMFGDIITDLGAMIQGGMGICLLYTSDAADERSSVDLGGRRIIKKKNKYRRDEKRTKQKIIETKIDR